MPSIRIPTPSESLERQANAYQQSISGYASELSNVRDPKMRELIGRKIEQARSNAARYEQLAREARERGD